MNEAYMSQYRSKLRTPGQIMEMIGDNYFISAGQAAGEPSTLYAHLHEVQGRAKNVRLQASLVMGDYKFLDPSMKDWLTYEAWFYGAPERRLHPSGMMSFMPADLSGTAPRKLTYKRPNMFWGVSSPMDEHGNLNISFGIAYEMDMLEAADIVVLEIKPDAPRTFGENTVNIRDVDFLVESEYPRYEVNPVVPGEVDLKIGKYIADLVDDRSVIQLGIGNIPNAVAQSLKDKKDLGVHTEMVTDSMAELYELGVITNKYKNVYQNKLVGTFVMGSKELYDFVDNNPAVEFKRGRNVNDPFVIAQNDNAVSINTCIQIDLTGQVASESIGPRQYSGTGGQFDTAFGAQRSRGGKSIIALHSTAKKGTISTIVPQLGPGTIVSFSRNHVDYVVTEYGTASLRGKSIEERVEALIAIAHPDFRDDLHRQAQELQIW